MRINPVEAIQRDFREKRCDRRMVLRCVGTLLVVIGGVLALDGLPGVWGIAAVLSFGAFGSLAYLHVVLRESKRLKKLRDEV